MRLKVMNIFGVFVAFLISTGCEQNQKGVGERSETGTEVDTTYAGLEAPMLAERVFRGKLPPLEQRIPVNPKVIKPRHRLGHYCDTWRLATVGAGNLGGILGRVNYASLVHWAMDWESLEPGIAERWDVSPDGRHFTFYLRKGLRFSDGHPFTTEDIAFIYKYVLQNKLLNPSYPGWLTQDGNLVKLKIIDKYTVRFSFPESNGTFVLYMAAEGGMFLRPKHYLKQFIPPFISEESADSIASASGFSKWNSYYITVLSRPCLNPDLPTLQPWVRITPREKAETQWIFERNPYYYAVDTRGRQLPYFDYVKIQNVSDVEQVYLKAVTGDIDRQTRHLEGDRARLLLQKQAEGNYHLAFYSLQSNYGIYINQTQEGDSVQLQLNRKQEFRLALSLAINRDEILKLLNWNMAPSAREIAIPKGWEDDPELLQWFRYDPAQANQILDSLGLQRNPEGWRLRPDGKQLVLTVYIIEFLPIDFLELVKEYWHEIGVRLIIKKMSYRSWWDFANAFKFDLISYGISIPGDRTLVLYPYHVIPYYSATYWGGKWGLWYSSKGKAGEKPPEEVLELYDIWDRIKREIDAEKQYELSQLLRYKSLKIGHTLHVQPRLPGIDLVKNNFYNVGEGFPTADWPRRGPAPDYPETYFQL